MDKALVLKLFELQNRLKPIVKDSPSYFKGRKYFDVNTLISTLKPHLEELKLIILQPLTNIEGKPAICTQIFDAETGESVFGVTPLPDSTDAQKAGGVITYYRRYALVSLLMVEGEEDDDSGGTDNKAPIKASVPVLKAAMSNDFNDALAAIAKIDRSDAVAIMAITEKINSRLTFTPGQREELLAKLRK